MIAAAVAAFALALPQSGIALQHGTSVSLVALNGRTVRTLAGWRIVPTFGSPVGTVYLRDRRGAPWRLQGGALERVALVPRVRITDGCFSTAPRTKICGAPYGRGRSRIFFHGVVVRGSARPHGHWLLVDVANGRLLAQWSGECEIPEANIGDPATGLAPVGRNLESFAYGWAGAGPVMGFPTASCGAGRERPGIYIARRWLHPLARGDVAALWR